MRKHILFLISFIIITSMFLAACGGAPVEEPVVEKPVAEEPEVEEPAVEEPVAEEPEVEEPTVEEPAVEEPAEPSGKLLIWVQQANQDV